MRFDLKGLIIHLFTLATLLVLPTSQLFAADIYISENGYVISYSGKIESGDYSEIISQIVSSKNLPATISLNSPGGSVTEAIKIGKLLRKGLFQSVIAENGICNSSCFILWASAVRRIPASAMLSYNNKNAKLGLHRPYFSQDEYAKLNIQSASESYRSLEKDYRAYLESIGTPEELLDLMLKTKSSEAVFINDEEMVDKLGQVAPFYEEWLLAKCGELPEKEQLLVYVLNTRYNLISSCRSVGEPFLLPQEIYR